MRAGRCLTLALLLTALGWWAPSYRSRAGDGGIGVSDTDRPPSSPPATIIGRDGPAPLPFLHPLFTDNMIFQHDQPMVVWGRAAPGEKIVVTLGNGTSTAAATADGSWRATLPARAAGGPYTLTVAGAGQTITRTNVVVGDVWLCSGQSNMEFLLANAGTAAADIADSHYPSVRLLTVTHAASLSPEQTLTITGDRWKVSAPETVPEFSAVCFIMGRALYKRLKIPVGLINASSGGSAAQEWISAQALAPIEDFREALAHLRAGTPLGEADPTLLWNGMIHPLLPFRLRGVAWYQGEANDVRPYQYARLLPALIADWRRRFASDLPFAIVQLPNAGHRQIEPVELASAWAILREAQTDIVRVDPRTSLTVTIDTAGVGAPDPNRAPLHPSNKADVGNRLARAILGSVYGQREPRPPIYARLVVQRRAVRVFFANLGPGERLMVGVKKGLDPVRRSLTGALTGFALRGADGKWVKARAIVDGATVTVSAPGVLAPQAVRYAWGDNPPGNLYSTAGLPASPFRSDRD